jgi:hypothetical protein
MMCRSLILFLAVLLAGCATPIETYVSSSGENGVQISSYQLGTEIRTEDGVAARESVVSSLAAQAIRQDSAAVLRLDVTFSALPAALRIKVGDNAPSAATKANIKTPRPSKKCEPVEYRLGVAFTDMRDGKISYRSSASEYHCMGDPKPIISALTDAVLKDVGNPKGVYVRERERARQSPSDFD